LLGGRNHGTRIQAGSGLSKKWGQKDRALFLPQRSQRHAEIRARQSRDQKLNHR
jgi:hypothetical protein